MKEEKCALKWAFNVGISIEVLFRCVKTLETYKKYVKNDEVLHEVITDLRYAIKRIDVL